MGNQAEFREIRRAPFRPRAHMQNLKSDTVHTPLCAPDGTWILTLDAAPSGPEVNRLDQLCHGGSFCWKQLPVTVSVGRVELGTI